MQSDYPAVRNLVGSLVPIVERCVAVDCASARSALYGMQGMRSANCAEAAQLFTALGHLLERSRPHAQLRTPSDVSNAMYGLQGLHSEWPTGEKVFGMVNLMLQDISPDAPAFSARHIAMSLYGLRSCSCNSKQALDILRTLSPHLITTSENFSANDVATALDGLRSFRSNQKPVAAVLEALAPHVARVKSSSSFNAKGLSMALSGLQGFSSSKPQVRDLVRGLARVMRRSEVKFQGFDDFEQLSLALYGLADLTSDSPEVQELLESFAVLLRKGRFVGLKSRASASAGNSSQQKTISIPRKWKRAPSKPSSSSTSSFTSTPTPSSPHKAWIRKTDVSNAVRSVEAADHDRPHHQVHTRQGLCVAEIPRADSVAKALYGLKVRYTSPPPKVIYYVHCC